MVDRCQGGSNAAGYIARTTEILAMTINWLATTAIAVIIGAGAAVAQSQPDATQRRDESPRAQSPSVPSRDAERPATGEQRPVDRAKDRAGQTEPKAGAKDPQRGEAASAPERKQAEEPAQQRETREPTKQGQDQPAGERSPARSTQQGLDEQKARDSRQSTDPKQQQQGQQQPGRDRNDSATTQPPATRSTQQGTRSGETGQDRRGENAGQTPGQSARRDRTSPVAVNDEQRTQIVERLRRERAVSNENIDVQLNIGERLPPRLRPRPLPPDIVRIAPQYRDYRYTVVKDQIVIVDPRTSQVVDVIREPRSAAQTTSRVEHGRMVITQDQRETLKQAARRMTTVGSTSPSGSMADSSCLTLQPVPEELVRSNPELGSYRYLAIGEQVVLVDPRQRKIVEVVD
jgi:hypothetical protein